jgi:signal transduction histidine kinase
VSTESEINPNGPTNNANRDIAPIVAIGASAGGLEPIEQFFDHIPADTGAVFVVIQHLLPDFRSMMPELLKRHSMLKIISIVDGTKLEPNVIYLGPPKRTLAIADGHFVVTELPDAIDGIDLPINRFFAQMAELYEAQSISIVMSGAGSDGALGSAAVAAVGGFVLAQDPGSAQFETMPRSVIDSLPGTVYAAPDALASIVVRALKGERAVMVPARVSGPLSSDDISRGQTDDGEHIVAPTSSLNQIAGQSILSVYDAVLEKVMGSCILTSRSGELLHLFGNSSQYIEIKSGHFSRKLSELIVENLRLTIKNEFEQISKSGETPIERKIKIKSSDHSPQSFTVVRISEITAAGFDKEAPLLISILEEKVISDDFGDMTLVAPEGDDQIQQRIFELEGALKYSEEKVQSTVEKLEVSNEELQTTNEELQATNEELMDTNEKLQAVNEQLHAVNEELFTVSSEHQSKIEELTNLAADLDNLLENTKIGVIFIDADARIRQITPTISQTFNILTRDVGRPIAHVTSRFDFPDLDATIKRVIAIGWAVERNIEVDGRDYLLRILPYRKSNTIDGAVITVVDISEIARANRSLNQFADIVSHDLKAPLRAIRSSAEWIIEDLGDVENVAIKEHKARLVEQTRRLSRMLDDLRDFSNIGNKAESAELVSVKKLLEEISETQGKDRLQLNFVGEFPILETYKAPLDLVIRNIIENAVEHNDRRPACVHVKAIESVGLHTFEIEDDGPGIQPIHHEKIFQPFRKLSAEESNSSGIGLALVKKVVEDNGGSITVVSDPTTKRGAKFIFTWMARFKS